MSFYVNILLNIIVLHTEFRIFALIFLRKANRRETVNLSNGQIVGRTFS